MGSIASLLQSFGKMTTAYANAYQMEQDAVSTGYKADYETQAAEVEEADFREQADQTIATGIARAGASGFDAETSAPAIDALVRRRELDAAAIRHGGKVGHWASKEEQKALEYGSQTARIGAHFVGAAGAAQAGGSAYQWWQSRQAQPYSSQWYQQGGGYGANFKTGYGTSTYSSDYGTYK